jgi:hypothetical protein
LQGNVKVTSCDGTLLETAEAAWYLQAQKIAVTAPYTFLAKRHGKNGQIAQFSLASGTAKRINTPGPNLAPQEVPLPLFPSNLMAEGFNTRNCLGAEVWLPFMAMMQAQGGAGRLKGENPALSPFAQPIYP